MAQTLDCGSDIRRVSGKKRLVAESTTEALRAWNDANELEKCPREESFSALFPLLGDEEAQDALRDKYPNKHHCSWLRRDPNACESLPAGIDGAEAGTVCPHNVYASNPEVFQNREGVMDTIERLFRLSNSAELGAISQSELDVFSITELLTTRGELDKQQSERQEREREKEHARFDAQSNKGKRF